MNIIRKHLAFLLALALLACGASVAEEIAVLPQIDNSTARIPITDAIYAHFTDRGATGPAPICSKTHGAWLNLADGKADIVFLVAPTAEEMQYFADAGVDIEMKIYGYDGLVFMGNASNLVENLTSSEIRSIYRGKITDWWGVRDAKNDGDIVPYIRNPESGSQRLFENLVWTGYEMPDFQALGFREGEVQGEEPYKMEEVDNMSEVTLNVMQNRYSIGYNIMSYVDNVFLSDEVEKPKVIATGSVNLRDWSDLDSEVIAAVPAGTELEYDGATRFDERDVAWYTFVALVDKATVFADGRLEFCFRNGLTYDFFCSQATGIIICNYDLGEIDIIRVSEYNIYGRFGCRRTGRSICENRL